MYISNELNNCSSLEKVVDLINSGVCEGVEGIEFTATGLAAQYAADASIDCHDRFKDDEIKSHLDILEESGAKFDYEKALRRAILLRIWIQG